MRHFTVVVLLAVVDVSMSTVLRTKPRVGTPIHLTRRVEITDADGTVNAAALNNMVARVSRKMRRAFRAYETNTGFPHPSDNTRHHKNYRRDTGSEELTDDDGALWHGAISVGTPPVFFTVDFDTGSSDLFLPGTSCKVNCAGHTLYDTNASSTAISLNDTFQLAFGDGSSVAGDQFIDTVTVANLTAVNQTVGAATNYSTGFSIDQFPPDGLLGMAFPEISVFGAEPFFQTLVAQNTTTAPQFSFKLAQNGSELFLGGVNTDLFSGPLTQAPVVKTGFWQVALDAVNVNGHATSTNLSAIIDTGTTLVLGDFASVVSVYEAIPGAKNATNAVGEGFFTFPCDTTPEISLTFDNRSFTISPETFNLGRVSLGSSDCLGGIAAFDSEAWIVGDVFLQNVYTVFDVGNKTVGFATLT